MTTNRRKASAPKGYEDDIQPLEEWEQDITLLARKIMKVVTGYARTDVIGATAIVLKHIASTARD
jgi:hypothetical protein